MDAIQVYAAYGQRVRAARKNAGLTYEQVESLTIKNLPHNTDVRSPFEVRSINGMRLAEIEKGLGSPPTLKEQDAILLALKVPFAPGRTVAHFSSPIPIYGLAS
jgi:transcriptional regulator with XRE-family HTH domain